MTLYVHGLVVLIIVATGLLFKYVKVNEINGYVGYRTPRSMKNQDNWNFAQKISPDILIKWTLIFFFISLIESLLFNDSQSHLAINLIVTMTLFMISLVIVFLNVEREIKKFEKQNGNG